MIRQATVATEIRNRSHEIDNGRLQFTYKAGALTKDQVQKIQINLDSEQKFFDLP